MSDDQDLDLLYGLSISDDDLCAECKHLVYLPGEMSVCTKVNGRGDWPCKFDSDGYAYACRFFWRQ